MGLGQYYQSRALDPALRPPRPDADAAADFSRFIRTLPDSNHELTLSIDGVQCGACVWLIEQVLSREPGVVAARVNLTSLRLRLVWGGATADAETLIGKITALGYHLVPFRAGEVGQGDDKRARQLVRALAVAGFAAGNVMFLSIAIWAGLDGGMGPATRGLLHWFSAMLALPAVAYAGRPFFSSALSALRHRRTNMDVPISIGVLLVSTLSLIETINGGNHTYFDGAVTLLLFLLIGRLLDHRARGQARATAERLLSLRVAEVAVLRPDGTLERHAPESVLPGMEILVSMGERIGVDGVIIKGESSLDTALVTGESLPEAVAPGASVFAGMVNLGAPLVLRATATGANTLLAEMARLIDIAETRRGRFVVLADRVAKLYAPVVHIGALATFLGWYFGVGASANAALLIAASVLIITCPCALALAVPVAQVIASGELLKRGMLLKSATALERLAGVDVVVFDKTGTLSNPDLALIGDYAPDDLRLAASLAATSRHPLSRALCVAAGPVMARDDVVEYAGLGLQAGEIRLGSEAFCGAVAFGDNHAALYLRRENGALVRFSFAETLRLDAAETMVRLREMGIHLIIASGDREAPVRRVADALGIKDWFAGQRPSDKMALVERLRAEGRHVLMVGDGLNDSPCLAAADVSMSPASAADISQTVADLVFQGKGLGHVATALTLARRTGRVMRENIALALIYNLLVVPVAIAGYVTPWLAAAAMSSSSLLVMGNALRLKRGIK